MGSDKALLKINDKSFIQQLMEELDFFEEKIISRNNVDIENNSWIMIPDIYPGCGPIGGLHSVLSDCQSDALFVVTCDMPFIQRSLVKDICESSSADYDAVIVKDNSGKIHPLCGVYKKSVSSILEEQIFLNNYRMMNVLDKIRVKYITLVLDKETQQLLNINTPDEYLKLKNK